MLVLALISSLALGDSIALGTGHALNIPTYAQKGIGSCAILRVLKSAPHYHLDRVVISAGVNDPPGSCDEAIRAYVAPYVGHVIWILPPSVNSARAHIQAVAAKYGDMTVSYIPGRDHLHPRSYQEVAAAVRRVW